MSKIKLVAMDLDNTLLDSEKQISKHTEEVLKEVIRRGVYIVPATGRSSPVRIASYPLPFVPQA